MSIEPLVLPTRTKRRSGTAETLGWSRPRIDGWISQSGLVRALFELVVAASVFVVYRAGRLVTSDSVSSATENAERVLDAQRWLTGTMEQNLQRWMLDIPGAIHVLNNYYVFVHFPATTIFLVWAFVRHRGRYPAIRNWFVGVTLAAMVIHVVFPLAPPRMLDGYVDTLRVYGPNIYPEDPNRSLANQFAAMPSLHFGWALMVAVGIIMVTTSRRRWWWLAHPAVTLLAIVATGNHYLLDAFVAAVLAGVVGLLAFPRRSARFESLQPGDLAATPLVAPELRPATTRRHRHRHSIADPARATAVAVCSRSGSSRGSCRAEDALSALS